MSKAKTDQNTPRVGLDDLVEDMFGLNVRGIHTLWAIFTKPRKVFESARAPDWSNRSYTPSIRLVFSLLAAMTAFRFLWSGKNSYLYLATSDIVFATGEFADRAQSDAFTDKMMDAYVFTFPLVFMALHFITALILFVWGKGTSVTVRIRLYYSVLIPGSLFSLFMTLTLGVTSESLWLLNSFIMLIGVMVLDFTTAVRGGVAGKHLTTRCLKAAVFAMLSLTIAMATNFIAFALSSAWVTAFSPV